MMVLAATAMIVAMMTIVMGIIRMATATTAIAVPLTGRE